MDARARTGDGDGTGQTPVDVAAEEQAWDEAMHQALNIARAEGKPAEVSTEQSTGGEAAAHADAFASAGAERISGPTLSPSVQSPGDREAEARKEAGVGIGLADDLRSVRTALVKAHLAGDFEAAGEYGGWATAGRFGRRGWSSAS